MLLRERIDSCSRARRGILIDEVRRVVGNFDDWYGICRFGHLLAWLCIYQSTSNGDARWIWWRIPLRRARLQTASFDGSHALRALDQVRR